MLRLRWPVPRDLQLEKGGRGETLNINNATPLTIMSEPRYFPFVNGFNDPRSSAPILVLTTRKRGVRERPSSKASFTKSRLIVFSSETHIDSFLVTLVYQRIELGVLSPLNVLKLGNGDLGHRGCSTIA